MGSDQKDEVGTQRGRDERTGLELRHPEGARSGATAPWHQKEAVEVVRDSGQDASGMRLLGGVLGTSIRGTVPGTPCRDYVPHLVSATWVQSAGAVLLVRRWSGASC